MKTDLRKSLECWVEQHLATKFLDKRASRLDGLTLEHLVHRKNPYLFMCMGHSNPEDVVKSFVYAHLSSSEETLFGNFLKGMALHVCKLYSGGQKPSTPGLDLDFVRDDKRYLMSVKSSPYWGNAEAKKKLAERLSDAKEKEIAKMGSDPANGQEHEIVTVIGCMYGESRQEDQEHHRVIASKDFWELISGVPDFYKEIVAPLQRVALAHREDIQPRINKMVQDLTDQFRNQFRKTNGEIDWEKIVEYNNKQSWPR